MANAIFLKFDGVDGECRETGHEGWIQIESLSHGLMANIDRVAATGSGGHAVGAADHADLMFSKALDKASLPILAKCCAGNSFDLVEIDLMTSTTGTESAPSQRILGIKLENVLVADMNYSDSAGAPGRPQETLHLNYKKITWTYSPYDDMGNPLGDIEKYWDLTTNTGG